MRIWNTKAKTTENHPMNSIDLKSPELYFDRELSWLEFNDRVMRRGTDPRIPLLERLKFLAITETNLDEFTMIRIAGLRRQAESGSRTLSPAGRTPSEQLEDVRQRTRWLVEEHTEGIGRALESLRVEGVSLISPSEWTTSDQSYLREFFKDRILPILTPLAIEEDRPITLLPGLRICIAVALAPKSDLSDSKDADLFRYAVVPLPTNLPRFMRLRSSEGESGARFALLEDAIMSHVDQLFPGYAIEGLVPFRITRDADVSIDDDGDAENMLREVELTVLDRRRRRVVRLEVAADLSTDEENDSIATTSADEHLRRKLQESFELEDEEVYHHTRLLDAGAFWELASVPGYNSLRFEDRPSCECRDLIGVDDDDFFSHLQQQDVLLCHPYEKFDPVVRMVRLAAEDPNVLAVKQTLYRTSGDSPIVAALEQAARNGKEVAVLVELKARFDEAQNVRWARRLEDAGCHVIYGVAGLKTHAKALLIVRREGARLRRYVHLSTGNYNDKTAKIYSDVGLMTSDRRIASDVASLFNLLTGYSESVGWSALTVEPVRMRKRIIELIDREIETSTPSQPGLILAKCNSLEHPDIIRALYRASQAGVRIKLNIRGICMLKPGIPGVSENIEVRSIIGRYLEHARIFYFQNGGHEEVYLSSADWMRRNLEKRFEILFPINATPLRQRLKDSLDVYFSDQIQADVLHRSEPGSSSSQNWIASTGKQDAQELLYETIREAAAHSKEHNIRYEPLRSPRE
jgi:polyphosphate kinase